MVFDFLWSWAETLRTWADRWKPEVRAWKDTEASAAKTKRAMGVFKKAVEGA
jgi:hypothetical protein